MALELAASHVLGSLEGAVAQQRTRVIWQLGSDPAAAGWCHGSGGVSARRASRIAGTEVPAVLYFVQPPRRALSRDHLLREVWKYQAELSTRTVDVHDKVEEDSRNPRWIVTCHGLGYSFDRA